MLNNKKIFAFLIILFIVLLSFATSSFASTLGTYNYDVTTLTSDEVEYIKACCNSVLDYCDKNSIELNSYPYYFVLSANEYGLDFSSEGELFHIALSSRDVYVSTDWGGSLNCDYLITFDFNTGSTEVLEFGQLPGIGAFGNGEEVSDLTIYYTNYSGPYVTENNDIDFFPLPLQGVLAPIVQETPLKGVLQEVVEILPVILVIIVGLIGLRKALSFLLTVLHRS